jgi:thymidylate synthase
MISTKSNFKTASEAFDYMYIKIKNKGIDFDDTKALFNVGFYIHNPSDKQIKARYRKWNKKYAAAEWAWYLSGDPNISKLGELNGSIPPIWKRMADSNGVVNSNYGYQWQRKNQLDKVVEALRKNPSSRQASISIYDGKEINKYSNDTPCTYAVQFSIIDNKLCMSVYMRSNDLWYGFCNDQYQFASLQEMVADRLSIKTGWYYHHAHNLHLYNNKI